MAPDIAQFIDIHAHILPGIDDGAKNLDESRALAQYYTELGVTRLIATPHFIPGTAWAAGRDIIADKIEELQEYLTSNNINLKVYPGMEIAYHKKLIDRLEKGLLQPLGTSDTYLLEPSFNDNYDDLLICARQIMMQGSGAILAHPERIPSFQETPEPLLQLVEEGLQVQLNIGSVFGRFGESSKKMAMYLIERNGVHFLASDAHSIEKRRPLGVEDWRKLTELLGDGLLTKLCISNPGSLLETH
jgi:protein-tyrosine phosphatase